MQPSLEDLQHSLNKACQMVVEISKGVHQWGQNRTVFLLHPDSPSRSQHGLGLLGKPIERAIPFFFT